jgi:tape measure domain-containing protein
MGQEVQYTLSLKDLLTGKLREADDAANHLQNTMSGVQSILGALGVAGGIAGVVAFGKSVVEAGTKVEDARVGLTTLLKDAGAASEVIQNTMSDATKTPFAFEGLLSANKALISAGENAGAARANVLNLANAIAATGGGDNELQRMVVNLQQIKNTGVATALDIKQFAFAGINIYKALDEAGIKHGENQKVTYEQITMALQKAHEEGGIYYNGLENMAGNTSVQISNLGDAMFQLSVKMFDDLKPAISEIITGLSGMISNLRTGWDWIVKNTDEIKNLSVAVGGVWLAYKAYNTVAIISYAWMMRQVIAESLLSTWNTITATTTGLLTTSIEAMNAAWLDNPIGIVVAGLILVGVAIYEAYQHSESFRQVVGGLMAGLSELGTMIKDVFGGIWDMISGDYEGGFERMSTAFSDAGGRLKNAFNIGYANAGDATSENETYAGAMVAGKTAKSGGGGAVGAGHNEEAKSVSPKGATSNKAVTINISINKMIETFKISTTNLQESTSKVHEAVSNVLLQAVNDSQIVANI